IRPVYQWWWTTVNFALLFYDHRHGDGPDRFNEKLIARVTPAGARRLARVTGRALAAWRALDRRQAGDPLVRRELRYAIRMLEHLVMRLDWLLAIRAGARGGSVRLDGRRLLADLRWLRREFLFLWRARNRPQGRRAHLKLLADCERYYASMVSP
ncbi:MAG: hypothetical protein AAB368_01955, partial [bacterium]